MSRESSGPGPLLAALGSGGALLSLWAPWYSFHIPQALLNRVDALAGQAGVLGPFIQQVTQEARVVGPMHVNAWTAFHQIDIVIALASAIAAIFALLALTGRGTGTGHLTTLAGALVVALAVYRIVDLPGPSELLHVMWGAYAAVACGALALAGGIVTARADERDDRWPDAAPTRAPSRTPSPAADPSWAEGGSVAPPAA